jgi:hypothetical protein
MENRAPSPVTNGGCNTERIWTLDISAPTQVKLWSFVWNVMFFSQFHVSNVTAPMVVLSHKHYGAAAGTH